MSRTRNLLCAAASAAALAAGAAQAQPTTREQAQPISLRDTFPIGSAGNLVCSAQGTSLDKAFADVFDRGYSVVCRDASAPVANLYALRLRGSDPAARLAAIRSERAICEAASASATVEDVGRVTRLDCKLRAGDVGYTVYLHRQGNSLFVAEGLAGYDSALRLGLRTLVADRPVPGEVSVATTGAGDPAAFARVQAGTLDPRRALDEAYRRNNSGNFAEAGEFFASLIGTDESGTRAEALVNQALQSSNLGRFGEAESLFVRARMMSGSDPVLGRRLRNYTALHLLNQGELQAALSELERVVEPQREAGAAQNAAVIDARLAERLNSEAAGRTALDSASATLTSAEKIQILDGQSMQLRGTILRLQGKPEEAAPALQRAARELQGVRGGGVSSTIWMRAQIMGELAAIAEARGQRAEAEQLHRASVALLETDYPGSAALLSARARLADFFARTGQNAEALSLYRGIVAANAESGTGSAVVRRALQPYFALLAAQPAGGQAAADLFLASQVAVRPGVAQTQAVLARELSGGSDEASRLFRQAVALTRDVERTRVSLARLQSAPESAGKAAAAAQLQAQLAEFQQAQVATQAQLAQFPRYRAVSPRALPLEELQALLGEDEAYYKLTVLDDHVYAVFATREGARAFRVDATPDQLEQQVDTLRATISLVEDGQVVTYPFDIETASGLYRRLFGPVAGELSSIRHLVFEPDGAMLRLPPNVLVEDEKGVAEHKERTADPDADAFDFTRIAWFGRTRDISTAVSARAFKDLRMLAPSRARNEYLGFGQNAPVGPALASSGVRAGVGEDEQCGWALAAWNQPISAAELMTARQALAPAPGADIVTGEEFTDTAILRRDDLDQYRIMHFATHGLVTPPRPECPARPSLLTSFGGPESDGLLSFREIFDLRLDADLIILSACDTASRASFAANEEAGLTTGGDFALDGLVRAFVGAGGRLVVASHWPVPDAYDATQRLVSGLFNAAPGTGTAAALNAAQRQLMEQPATSHPYYWAGFAVVGDGRTPVIRTDRLRTAGTD